MVLFSCFAGAIGYVGSSSLTPRYAMSALIQSAEIGTSGSETPDVPFSPFSKTGSSTKQEAISYIEFDYISGNKSQDGTHLVEVKDEKATDLIQVVAEGPDKLAIKDFLHGLLVDLQKKYENKITDILNHSNERIKFLRAEVSSLQSFKDEVENALQNVGPSPSLVVQLMDLKHDIVRLEQELMTLEANVSPEKIHNFKVKSIHLVNGGQAVWPKRSSFIMFSSLLGLIISSYFVFLMEMTRRRKKPGTSLGISSVPDISAAGGHSSGHKENAS